MNLFLRIVLYSISVFLLAEILPGITVTGATGALLTGFLLILLNATVKPILKLLSLPITFFTLGLFLLVVNGIIILLADALLEGFAVDGFGWAIVFSIFLSVITSVLEKMLIDEDKKR